MNIKEINTEYVGLICRDNISPGDKDRYAFVYLGDLYLPPECIGKNIKVTVKVEIDT